MSLGSVAERFLFIFNPRPCPFPLPPLPHPNVVLEIDSHLILSVEIPERPSMGQGQKALHRPDFSSGLRQIPGAQLLVILTPAPRHSWASLCSFGPSHFFHSSLPFLCPQNKLSRVSTLLWPPISKEARNLQHPTDHRMSVL